MNNKKLMILLTCLQLATVPFVSAMKPADDKTPDQKQVTVLLIPGQQGTEMACVSSCRKICDATVQSNALAASAQRQKINWRKLTILKLTIFLAKVMSLGFMVCLLCQHTNQSFPCVVPIFAIGDGFICVFDDVLFGK